MKQDIPPENFTAHDRRDKCVVRCGLLAMGLLLGGYFLAVAMGWLPATFTPRRHEVQTATDGIANPSLKTLPQAVNPEPYLGVAFQGTRFRFDFERQEAVVTRPDFQSEEGQPRALWMIPSVVSYQGRAYPVTALSATALLYADGVTSVTFPSTLRNFNGAHELIKPELETLILQRPNDGPLIFTPAEFIAYVNQHYPHVPLKEGETP